MSDRDDELDNTKEEDNSSFDFDDSNVDIDSTDFDDIPIDDNIELEDEGAINLNLDDLVSDDLEEDILNTDDDLDITDDDLSDLKIEEPEEQTQDVVKIDTDEILPEEEDYLEEDENLDDDENFNVDSMFETDSYNDTFMETKSIDSSFDLRDEFVSKIEFTDKDFEKFTMNLERMPLKLKQSIEVLIVSDDYDTNDILSVINSLIANESAYSISRKIKRITKEDINVPRNYIKKLAFEYEQEKKSFKYRYAREVSPLLRVIGIITSVFVLFFLVAFLFAFKPFYAEYFYDKGIDAIRSNQFSIVEPYFNKAYSIWPDSNKLVEYATEYVNKRQYTKAYDKYIKLLGEIGEQEPRRKYDSGIDPEDQTGIYNFANFLTDSYVREDDNNFILARSYIKRLIRKDRYDYKPLVALGDLYIKWGDFIKNDLTYKKVIYEQARSSYADAAKLNQSSDVIQSMIRYLIRVDDYDTVKKLEEIFMQKSKIKEINWNIFLQVSDYYLDKNKSTKDLNSAYNILMEGLKRNEDNPKIYYNLARYYVLIDSSFKKDDKRELAAEKALELLNNLKLKRGLNSEEFLMKLNSYKILARYYVNKQSYFSVKNILDNTPTSNFTQHKEALQRFENVEKNIEKAKDNYIQAIKIYEENLGRGTLKIAKEFGSLYYELGNIYYKIENDFEISKNYYLAAIANNFNNKSINYKLGFLYYNEGDYKNAIKYFYKAQDMLNIQITDTNLLFAIANSNYKLKNYDQSIANYRIILKALDNRREKFNHFNPRGDLTEEKLLKYQIMTINNIGVAYIKLVENNINNRTDYLSKGLDYLRVAQQKSTDFLRDSDTEERSGDFTVAQSNLSKVLDINYLSNVHYNIYDNIFKDLYLDEITKGNLKI